MRPHTIIWPALLVAVLGVPVIGALLQRVPNALDVEMLNDGLIRPRAPIDLGVAYAPDGVKRAQVGLWQSRPERMAGHQEIHLIVAAYDSPPTLLNGELRIRGTECVYRTDPGALIGNGQYLIFRRSTTCAGPFPDSASGRIDLSLTFRGEGHLGLYAQRMPASVYNAEWMSFSDPASAGDTPLAVVDGRYIDVYPGFARRRADLLAYVWQVSTSSVWLWVVVGSALILVFGAGVMLTPVVNRDGAAGTVSGVAGIMCLGLGLALLYVGLTPPLQAADEPDHMLAFANVAHRPDLAEGTAALAKTGHFDRIRFHGDHRFRAVDVGSPAPTAWGTEVFAQDVAARSATTWLWWEALAGVVGSLDAAHTLLAIRLANAFLFALLLGVAAALVRFAAADMTGAPHVVVLALLLVPTLPFFATYVSEFALLTSTYVFAAALTAGLCLDGRRVHLLGLPLGVAFAWVFGGGRSGMPLGAVLASVVAGRAWLGSRSDAGVRADISRSVVFWAGLGIGLATFEVLSTPAFSHGLWPVDTGQVPERVKALVEALRAHPGWIVVLAPIGFAIEMMTSWIRRRLRTPGRFVTGMTRWLCYGVAAAVVSSLLVSLFVTYPGLETLENNPVASAKIYAARVVMVGLSGFRLVRHDLLVSSLFWEGFGWNDALPGDGLVSVLVLLNAAAAIGLLIHVGRSGQVRRAVWLGVLTCGWVGALVLYAVSSYYLRRNLMGRYLVGLYLSSLAVFWVAAALLPRRRPSGVTWLDSISREWLIAAAACGVHGWALRFILMRYF